ncbi:hypothetical protein [Bosea sp. MMO-172]|uniref:hypothetical protein n=1 Tax=Bosea sp. MMO-172 TaxID=3127885 RepID=UPI003018A81F
MHAGMQARRERRTRRLDAQTFGKIDIDDEKGGAFMRSVPATAKRQCCARTPDGEHPLQRLTALVVITEQKNDDAASEEASISTPRGLMNRKAGREYWD